MKAIRSENLGCVYVSGSSGSCGVKDVPNILLERVESCKDISEQLRIKCFAQAPWISGIFLKSQSTDR